MSESSAPLTPSTSASISIIPMSGFSTSTIIVVSTSTMLVLGFFAQLAPPTFISTMPGSGSSAPSTLSMSASLVPGSSTSSVSVVPFIFPHTPTLGRCRLIDLDGRIMRTTSEKLAPVYTCQLLFNKHPSLLFFSYIDISKKQLFDKAFDINSLLLAQDHVRKVVNLDFGGCQCFPSVKDNRT